MKIDWLLKEATSPRLLLNQITLFLQGKPIGIALPVSLLPGYLQQLPVPNGLQYKV
jgi:hypothetical protein